MIPFMLTAFAFMTCSHNIIAAIFDDRDRKRTLRDAAPSDMIIS